MKMNKRILTLLVAMAGAVAGFAQWGGGGGWKNMNVGHYYGKLVDSINGKPIEFAVVQLWGAKYDTTTKSTKYGVIAGCLTKSNGEFSLENLPIFGELTLKISAMGYINKEQKVSFNIDFSKLKKGQGQGQNQNSDNPMSGYSGALNAVDKDLGNIKLSPDVKQLGEVNIVENVPDVEIKLDKKIYNVEKNMTTTGGTAEDVLKNVPSVSVDMDGNVTMRNSSPQIFVDGRPSTLTIDQIPADAISTIEVISNPSAKYDASGGMSGIINIVLKKNRKTGYNGSVRAGVDQRGKLNGGGDFNVRENKINFFISAFGNQRKSLGQSETWRNNLIGSPLTKLHQLDPSVMDGYFGFGRIGFDYFINNRNTITLSQNFGIGVFKSLDSLSTHVDTLGNNTYSDSKRTATADRNFHNLGTSLLYKHLFPTEGRELTADVNYNANTFGSVGDYETHYYNMSGSESGTPVLQKQDGIGGSQYLTAQTDYTTPFKKTMKFETGLRASVKDYNNNNTSSLFDPYTNTYVELHAFGSNYTYSDQVYAAYGTFSQEIKKFTYQLGLRVESSVYSGKFVDSTTKYSYQYPLTPFPSAFMTYHINDKNDLQFSYSRRINRPNFFQLIPTTDYSDSLNVKRGNPALKPEFTNSLELSYLINFNRSNSLMFTGFYKYSTDLITNYQVLEFNTLLNRDVVVNTYENALSSNSYGMEITAKNSIKKWLEISANGNFYYSVINATNVDSALVNKRFNWFAKLNLTFHLPKNMSLQLSGQYTAKSNLPLNSGGGGRWGGMGGGYGGGGYDMMHGGSTATAQGYSLPVYFIDAAFKIDFLKDKKASLTLNAADILKSRINQTHSESSYFIQDTKRTRDQLFFRLSFSYRFGKFDVSLFKRKNMRMNTDGMQDMGM
jgi:outer membrane receptor protein involved in Fe transport